MGRVERGRTGGAGEDGGDGGGCFQDQSRAPTGAGVSLPIQPDEHRFVSLRFEPVPLGCSSENRPVHGSEEE